MKKKFLLVLLVVLLTCVFAISLSACHEHTFDQQVVSDVFKKADATCTQKATYYLSCSCGGEEHGTATFESGEPLGHSYSEWVSNGDGTHTKTCANDNTHQVSEECSFDSDKKCSECDYVKIIVGTEIYSNVFKIEGINLYVKVPNNQEIFDFSDTIEVAENAEYKVYKDIEGSILIGTYMSNLSLGDNVYYITVINEGYVPKTYIVTVRRRYMYTVTFDTDGGFAIDSQTVEEDQLANKPDDPTKDGYTFDGWDYDLTQPITDSIEITAKWKANIDTAYKVEYYFENVEGTNYVLDSTYTQNEQGTTDTTTSISPKDITHFTFNNQHEDNVLSGNIESDGSLVLKLYYSRKKYALSNANEELGSITNTGSFRYGTRITAIATPKPVAEFLGWYSGDILVSSKLTEELEIGGNVEARFNEKQDIKMFTYTVNGNDVKITGLKSFYTTGVTIPDYVTSIGREAFSTLIRRINYKGTIDQWVQIDFDGPLNNSAAYYELYINDTLVTEVNITTATTISSYAFDGCSSITSVILPNTVSSIGYMAFNGCHSLTRVDYSGTIDQWVQIDFGGLAANPLGYADHLYINDILVTDVNITATTISSYAFEGYDSLTSITITDSVTSVGSCAFSSCSSLTRVDYTGTIDQWVQIDFCDESANPISYAQKLYINDELVTEMNLSTANVISNYVFAGYDLLTNVTIPDNVTSIGDGAFYNCWSLESISIGNNVASIGDDAFLYCFKLAEVVNKSTHITVQKGSQKNGYVGYYALGVYNGSDTYTTKLSHNDGFIIYTDETEKILVGYTGNQTEITIPSYFTKINQYAFFWCSSLTNVVISDNVTIIGDNAFYGCLSLENVTIGSSVTKISSCAFRDCSLSSIKIPKSVTEIGSWALECNTLTNIEYEGTVSEWNAISKGRDWNHLIPANKVICTDGEVAI